jgi:hypothetical protein
MWQNLGHPTFNVPILISFINNFLNIKLGFGCHVPHIDAHVKILFTPILDE